MPNSKIGEHPLTITWHSSCHALREMDVIRYSKALLRQLKNVMLVELEARDGMLRVRRHLCRQAAFAISAAMVKDKVDDIRRTGATTLVAGDCGCLMNITGAMEHAGVAIAGKHLAEFLWERTHAQ